VSTASITLARRCLALALVSAACGSSDDAWDPGACVEITASSFRFAATADSGWFTAAYGAGIEPELGEGWQALGIKLRARDGVDQGPGFHDLAQEPPSSDECSHCVYVTYAGSGDHFQLDQAIEGSIEIEAVDLDRGQLQATLRDVTFRHLQEVALHSFQGWHEDAHCVHLEEAVVDTRAIDGAPCLQAGDCPNAVLQACDPGTAECKAAACSRDDMACEGDGVCQIQDPFFGVGACYERCVPFTSGACGDGRDCIPIDYVGEVGVCKLEGPEAPEPTTIFDTGRTCEPRQIATGCGPDHVCATEAVYWHYDHCYRQCDYFADDPGCEVGGCWLGLHDAKDIETTYLCGVGDCHFGGLCVQAEDDIALGEPCEEEGWTCRGEDARLGRCMPDADGALRCARFCRLEASDCAAGQSCEPVVVAPGSDEERVIEGLGYCR